MNTRWSHYFSWGIPSSLVLSQIFLFTSPRKSLLNHTNRSGSSEFALITLDNFFDLIIQHQHKGTAHASQYIGPGTFEESLASLVFGNLPPAVQCPRVHNVSCGNKCGSGLRNSGGKRLFPWETSAHSVTNKSLELQPPAPHCVQLSLSCITARLSCHSCSFNSRTVAVNQLTHRPSHCKTEAAWSRSVNLGSALFMDEKNKA